MLPLHSSHPSYHSLTLWTFLQYPFLKYLPWTYLLSNLYQTLHQSSHQQVLQNHLHLPSTYQWIGPLPLYHCYQLHPLIPSVSCPFLFQEHHFHCFFHQNLPCVHLLDHLFDLLVAHLLDHSVGLHHQGLHYHSSYQEHYQWCLSIFHLQICQNHHLNHHHHSPNHLYLHHPYQDHHQNHYPCNQSHQIHHQNHQYLHQYLF